MQITKQKYVTFANLEVWSLGSLAFIKSIIPCHIYKGKLPSRCMCHPFTWWWGLRTVRHFIYTAVTGFLYKDIEFATEAHVVDRLVGCWHIWLSSAELILCYVRFPATQKCVDLNKMARNMQTLKLDLILIGTQ